jgi:hypothetical protein
LKPEHFADVGGSSAELPKSNAARASKGKEWALMPTGGGPRLENEWIAASFIASPSRDVGSAGVLLQALSGKPLFAAFRENGNAAAAAHGGPPSRGHVYGPAIKAMLPRSDTYVMICDAAMLMELGTRADVQAAVTALLTKYDATAAGACLLIPCDMLAAVWGSPLLSAPQKQAVFAMVERWLLRGVRWASVVPLSASIEAQLFSSPRSQDQPAVARESEAPVADSAVMDGWTTRICQLTAMTQAVHKNAALLTGSDAVQTAARDVFRLKPVILLKDLMAKLAPQ